MAAKNAEKKNIFKSLKSFFKGLKTEFRKIIWPTKEQTGRQTVAVVVISLVLCAFIRLIDVLAQLAIGALSSIG